MGGCYSSDSGHALASPRHKLPADRQPGHREREPQYCLLTNGDSQHKGDEALKQSIVPVSANTGLSTSDSHLLPEDVGKVKGVAPSDSGIESIGAPVELEDSACDAVEKKEVSLCRSCHNKLKRISRGSCHQCGQFRLDASELSALLSIDTYCTCGPRQAGKQSSCLTHGPRNEMSPSPKRHSDIPARLLKSNLKKQGQERGDSKHVRMSWKSADSLDLNSAMNTCMDRVKSEASDVFGDDVSFRAPLAHFDSVDNHLDGENVNGEDGGAFVTSRMSICSEILELADSICHCGSPDPAVEDRHVPNISTSDSQAVQGCTARQTSFSRSTPTGLPSEQLCSGQWAEEDEDSGHGMSKSEGHLGSSSDCVMEDAEEVEDHGVDLHPAQFGYAAVNVLENLSSECEEVQCPVSVVVKGHQMIMMHAKTYAQLLNDLHVLKQQLILLSQVIQGEEVEEEREELTSSGPSRDRSMLNQAVACQQ